MKIIVQAAMPWRWSKLKALLVMKCTLLFLLWGFVQGYGKAYSQNAEISLSLHHVHLSRALSVIERKTNYRFLYNDAEVSAARKVSLDVNKASLAGVLDRLLADTHLSYNVLRNNLVVIAPSPQTIGVDPVTGTVTDSAGAPLVGVTIQVKGTSLGTASDAQGRFTLDVPDTATLIVSYVGFETREVAIKGQTPLHIILRSAATALNQVVVVGYGTQRKIDVTGSVDEIKGAEISKQASTNAVSALQGKVAGVQISNSGTPGGVPTIRIRGLGTVYGNAAPLYVVDGVWLSDISFLNPADIDNISILKDASAESIYGIRAANGVVLITTKKGKEGHPVVNYNGYAGFQRVTNKVKMANGSQYATLINEKSIYSGGDTLLSDPAQYGAGTDWYSQILRDAFVTSHQVSVTGGSDKNSYNFSLGYLDQDGIVKTNNYKRITASLQNDIQIFNSLKAGYTVVGAQSYSKDINASVFHDAFGAPPVMKVRDTDGSYGDPADFGLGQSISNPQVDLDVFNQQTRSYRFTGNAYAELTFLRHFKLRTSFGGEFGQNEIRGYTPVYNATSTQANSVSKLTLTRSETRNWILENTLTYDNTFGDHHLTVLAGQGAQRYKYNNIIMSAQNVPESEADDYYLSLGNNYNVTDVDQGNALNPAYPLLSTIASYFGRVNYAYQDKYLLTASLRADGSSKFPSDERWGYFPSVGVGWVISREEFMKNQHVFSTLKLRGSWGKIGNASVPPNLAVSRVDQSANLTAIFGMPGQAYTGASITAIVPPVLYWERGGGTDVGLEGALLNDRLTFEADYYDKRTEKAIFDVPILGSLGTSNSVIIANQADFQNRGVEVTLGWNDHVSEAFSYSISGNFSMNNNKVLSVATGKNPIYGGQGATGGSLTTRTVVGGPIGEFYGYQVIGIFQSADDVAKSPQAGSAKPGDFIYKDVNGDGVISGLDRIPMGNPNPKYFYGLNTSFTYRQFDLSLDFQGVADVSVYDANQGLRYGNENYTEDFFAHRWHGPGTSNTDPSANIGGNQNYQPNTWFVESGSYFRVRNLQLGFTLPEGISSRWKLQKLRIYANAQNPFNFFSYKGFSPEISGGSPTSQNIDTNVYPLYATFNFGVNLSF